MTSGIVAKGCPQGGVFSSLLWNTCLNSRDQMTKKRCLQHSYADDLCFALNATLMKILMISELTLNPPEGIIAGPINEENFFEWEALITYVYILFKPKY